MKICLKRDYSSCMLLAFVCSFFLGACGGNSSNNGGQGNSPPPQTFTIGGTVSGLAQGAQLTLENNGGNALVITGDGAFVFATPVVDNGAYAVTVGNSPPGQTCTVSAGTGTGVTANVTNVGVICSVAAYTIGGTVSGLAAGAQLELENNGSDPLVVTANGAFTFAIPVAQSAGYAVTLSTRPLGEVCSVSNGSGTGVAASVASVNVSCTSTPGFAYVPNFNNATVSQYKLATDGTLTPMATATVATGAIPNAVAVDPKGRYAYVTNRQGNSVSQYAIGPDGSLSGIADSTTGLASVPAGGTPASVAVDPLGKYVYAVNQKSGAPTVSQYAIGAHGALTPIAAATPVVTGAFPISVAVDTTGKYVYVASETTASIWQYAIGSDGSLTGIADSVSGLTQVPTTGTSTPTSIAVDPAGGFIYVGSIGTAIITYSIGTNGALALVAATPEPGFPLALAIDPTGQFLYAGHNSVNAVSQFSIGGGGVPVLGTTLAIGAQTAGIAVGPTGKVVYLVTGSSVLEFSVGAGGQLTPLGSVAAGPNSQAIAITL
jgi:6-phosphogluconolactonase (cycloisomerase 2 family)